MKRTYWLLLCGICALSGAAIGAANPFNPSGTFSQSYLVVVDPATGNPVNVVNGALSASCN